MSEIRVGLIGEITRQVEKRHLAPEWGSGLAPVLATPALVAFCEECARLIADPRLPEGQQTVGSPGRLPTLRYLCEVNAQSKQCGGGAEAVTESGRSYVSQGANYAKANIAAATSKDAPVTLRGRQYNDRQ